MQYQNLTESDIPSRFHYLLKERALRSLYGSGLIEPTLLDVTENGRLPSDDFLGKTGMLSNTSITWLLENKGAPFNINHFEDDDEASIHLDELLAEGYQIYRVASRGGEWCLALTLPTQLLIDGKWFKHTNITVLAGNLGPLTLERLEEASATQQVSHLELTEEDFELLKAGWLGL